MPRVLENMVINLVGLGLMYATWYVFIMPLLLRIAATIIVGAVWFYAHPIISLLGLYGASEVTRDEVLACCKINVWFTAPEIARQLEAGKRKVSAVTVLLVLGKLREEGLVKGRERIPREPALSGIGNIWEYARVWG